MTDEQCTYALLPHRLTIIPGHAAYRYTCPDTMDICWAHFTATVWGSLDLFTVLGCPGMTIMTPEDTTRVQQLWDRLLAACAQETVADSLEADGLLRLLLAETLSSMTPPVAQHFNRIERFRELLAYIDQHLEDSFTLKSLAERVNLHPTYFANLFAQSVGTGPMTYILHRRIARAQGLLRHSTLPIDAIANAVGYADACYFSRIFSRHTGLCPTKYRERCRITEP